MATVEEPRDWITNFHDVYMNANLMRTRMMAEPLEAKPEDSELALIQQRFRLERIWHCFLYVTIEAWKAAADDQRQLFLSSAEPEDIQQVDRLLRAGDDLGYLDHLRSIRDYMCHRDKREYWDSGRIAVVVPGMFQWALKLDRAISSMVLSALRTLQSHESQSPSPSQ